MVKMIYGGFEAAPEGANDEPWTKLDTVSEYLQAGEALPPHLAQWLDHAIIYANRDPNELLKRLGLKKRRGRVNHVHSPDAWLEWGKRVYHFEGPLEGALEAVILEYTEATGLDLDRTQLQRWRGKYGNALEEGRRP